MPRRPRVHADGHWYHVWNRGARKLPIFGDDGDRHLFLWVLGRAAAKHGVEVHGYCLLGNHFHLVVHCPLGNIDRFMHHVGTVYTQRFNRTYALDGPLFKGRFDSRPIETDSELLVAVRYVDLNPVKHGITDDPGGYPWSSHRAYLDPSLGKPWLHTSFVLALLGGDRTRYEQLIQAGAARARAASRASAPTTTDPHSIEQIEAVVLELVGGSREQLSQWGKGCRVPARLLVLLLAAQFGQVATADLADRYRAAGPATIRSALARARARLSTDPKFASLHRSASSRLARQ